MERESIHKVKHKPRSLVKRLVNIGLVLSFLTWSLMSLFSYGCRKKETFRLEEETLAWDSERDEIYVVSEFEKKLIPNKLTSPDGKGRIVLGEECYIEYNGRHFELPKEEIKLKGPERIFREGYHYDEKTLQSIIDGARFPIEIGQESITWSNDSELIAYAVEGETKYRIPSDVKYGSWFSVDFSAIILFSLESKIVRITDEVMSGDSDIGIDFSPDGKYLAYEKDDDVFIADLEKGTNVNLTKDFKWVGRIGYYLQPGFGRVVNSNPRFSPDGKYILYSSERLREKDGKWVHDIFKINNNGENKINLTLNDVSYTAIWSPNGKKIAYVSGSDIFIMNNDGSNKKNLTDTLADEMDPIWSSDGKKVYFNRYEIRPIHTLDR